MNLGTPFRSGHRGALIVIAAETCLRNDFSRRLPFCRICLYADCSETPILQNLSLHWQKSESPQLQNLSLRWQKSETPTLVESISTLTVVRDFIFRDTRIGVLHNLSCRLCLYSDWHRSLDTASYYSLQAETSAYNFPTIYFQLHRYFCHFEILGYTEK